MNRLLSLHILFLVVLLGFGPLPSVRSAANRFGSTGGLNNAISAANVSALRTKSGTGWENNTYALTSGYYAAGDGGGGTYVYNSTSNATNDGRIAIQPT